MFLLFDYYQKQLEEINGMSLEHLSHPQMLYLHKTHGNHMSKTTTANSKNRLFLLCCKIIKTYTISLFTKQSLQRAYVLFNARVMHLCISPGALCL